VLGVKPNIWHTRWMLVSNWKWIWVCQKDLHDDVDVVHEAAGAVECEFAQGNPEDRIHTCWILVSN
jgi:hypothetical protein